MYLQQDRPVNGTVLEEQDTALSAVHLLVLCGIALLERFVDVAQVFGVGVVPDEGGVELSLGDAIVGKDGIDVLAGLLGIVGSEAVDHGLRQVVVIEHLLHFAFRQDVVGPLFAGAEQEY